MRKESLLMRIAKKKNWVLNSRNKKRRNIQEDPQYDSVWAKKFTRLHGKIELYSWRRKKKY
jgi:hypothetical protein